MSKFTIDHLKIHAASKGGNCLNDDYLGYRIPHIWRCAENHEWSSVAANVLNGTWCPVCAGKQKLSMLEMNALAKKYNGACTSIRYKNSYSPLNWRCHAGHEWTATYTQIKDYGWCRECAEKPIYDKCKKFSVAKMKALELDGVCLSDGYVNNKEKLQFKCSENHLFNLSFNKLMSAKAWCVECNSISKEYSLNEILSHVSCRGGKLLGFDGKTYSSEILLSCGKDHKWRSTLGRLMKNKQWCPDCAKELRGQRLTIDTIKSLALSKNGQCLSSEMSDRFSRLIFQCEKLHKWESSAFSLFYSNSWCPHCFYESRKLSDEEKVIGLKRLIDKAATRGGSCLSTEYMGVNKAYLFQCEKGHKWSTDGVLVLSADSWCPECAGKLGETLSIEYIRESTGFTLKKVRPKWLKGLKGKALELDAYCEEAKLAIEYQGQQHYEFIPAWHKTIEYFNECVARDELKRKLCAEHGVILFEIPYVNKPTKEKMKIHIETLAKKACTPYAFNSEYLEFLNEGAGKASNDSSIEHPISKIKE